MGYTYHQVCMYVRVCVCVHLDPTCHGILTHMLPPSPTCKWVRIGQVVTRQVHKGSMLRVDKLWLGSHVVGVFHGVGRVDHIHLQQRKSH